MAYDVISQLSDVQDAPTDVASLEKVMVQIDATHFAMAVAETDNINFANALTIYTFTLTSANVVSIINTYVTTFYHVRGLSIDLIDSTHFILFFTDNDSGTCHGNLIVYAVDTSYNILQSATSYYIARPFTNPIYPSVKVLDSTHFILATLIGTTSAAVVNIYSYSASIALVSTLTHDTINPTNETYFSLALIDSTHFALSYNHLETNTYLKVFSVDTSYTVAQLSSIQVFINAKRLDLIKVNATIFAMAYQDVANSIGILETYSYNSTNTIFSVVTSVNFGNTTVTVNQGKLLRLDDANIVLVNLDWVSGLANPYCGTVNSYNISTTGAIAYKTAYSFLNNDVGSSEIEHVSIVFLSASKCIISYTVHLSGTLTYILFSSVYEFLDSSVLPTTGTIQISIGGVWKLIPANSLQLGISGVYKSGDIRTINIGGVWRNVVVNTHDTTPPSDVTNLATGTIGHSSVDLSWHPVIGIKQYLIWFTDSSNPYTTDANVQTGDTSTSYSLGGLLASTTYYIKMKAQDFAGNVSTNFSNEVTFTTTALPGTTT